MKNKLNVGFITTVSGRWPRELPRERKINYENFLKAKNDFDYVFLNDIVDSQQGLEDAVKTFKQKEVDVIIQLYGAFSGDDCAIFLAENLNVPIILWAPYEPPFDGGRLLANALVACTMNSASLKRLGFKTHYVYGGIEDSTAVLKLENILTSYKIAKALKSCVLGLFGYRPTAFYNSTFDERLIRKTFGVRMEETDLKVIFDEMDKVDPELVEKDVRAMSSKYDVSALPEGNLERHSRLYFALKKVFADSMYSYATIKCWPEMGNLKTTPCAVLGRLADDNVNIGCEGDVDALLALMVQNIITNEPCFVTDMINVDKEQNTFTFWHCGNVAEKLMDKASNPVLCNHPLAGNGTAFWTTFKAGNVTGARFCNIDGVYKLFIFKGEALPTVRNTRGAMVNVKIKTPVLEAVDKIIENAIPHHYSIVWADVYDKMIALAKLLGLEVIEL